MDPGSRNPTSGSLRGAKIRHTMNALLRPALAALLLAAAPGARAAAEPGSSVENVELKTITGGKEKLLSAKAKANVLVFVRTGQERSADALKMLAACEKEFAAKPVRWVAIVSSTEVPEEVKAMIATSGVAMPVLVDPDDVVYGRLGVRLHPMVGIVDAAFKVRAFEMYRQIDYCEIVKARIRLILGEIDQAAMDLVLDPPKGTMPGDDPRDVARRDVNLGKMLLKRKQYDKAMAAARKALEKAPVPSAFALIGDIQAAQGQCAEALKSYAQALKLDPKEPAALAGQAACAGK